MKNILSCIKILSLTLITSMAHAEVMISQVLFCGTIKVSTNSGASGIIGAAVITKSALTAQNEFILQASNSESSKIIQQLSSGDNVTILGLVKVNYTNGSSTILRNTDGTIDMQPLLYIPGCR